MLTNIYKDNILSNVVDARVSYIGNTPAFQAGKVGSIPTTRSIKAFKKSLTQTNKCFKMKKHLRQACLAQLDRATPF